MDISQTIKIDKESSVFILNIKNNIKHINKSIIPTEQIKEIDQYKKIEDKNKRFIARTFLFSYLKNNYDVSGFEFSYTNIKRPTFKYIDIDFNISYSKDLTAIAISTNNRIGVDIEHIDHSFDIDNTSKIFMNKKESNIFKSLEKKERFDYFYRLWTYKESLVKLLGEGLYLDLKEITNFETNGLKISKYQPFISDDYHLTISKFK